MEPLQPPSQSPLDAIPPGLIDSDPDEVGDFQSISQLKMFRDLADSGVDLYSLFSTDNADKGPTRDGQKPPGQGVQIALTEEERVELAADLCDFCDRSDSAIHGWIEQEAEIRNNYDRIPDMTRGGQSVDSSHMVCGITKSLTDQATARLTTNVTSIDPLIKVTAIEDESELGKMTTELAGSTEKFLNEYATREVRFEYLLPRMISRATKVGECVARFTWEEKKKAVFVHEPGKSARKEKMVGRVDCTLIDNPHVILWPPNLIDWQTGYRVVGHNDFLSKPEWRRQARKLRISEEDRIAIEASPGEENKVAREEGHRHGISTAQMDRQELLGPEVMLTELYCDLCLPNQDEPCKFHVILHRPTRKILFISYNEFHSQKHPYFPLRYELQDSFAHGKGVGHDVLFNQGAGDALWNLELDNVFSGAYFVTLRKSGTGYKTATQPLRPGAEIEVDDMDDIKTIPMGGSAQGIPESKAENLQDARETSGMASVLSGMGDPVMKSGAGTGSTNALIEQASMKIRLIDRNMRTDLSAMYMFILELVTQYAPDGLFYLYTSDKDAQVMQRLKWTPPQGKEIGEVFHLNAQAPSITSSDDARKQLAITLWGFAIQQVQALSQQVIPVLQAENPTAVSRWQRECAEYLSLIGQAVVNYADLPGVKDATPQIPEPIPEDQQIQQLQQQLQQLQQQLQQTQQEMNWQMTHGRFGLREQVSANFKDLPPDAQQAFMTQTNLSPQQQAQQGGGQDQGQQQGPPQQQMPPQPGSGMPQ